MKAYEVLNLLKISRPTLCKYVKEGVIHTVRRPNGYYMYCDEDVYRLMNKSKDRKSVIYARVSSACQKKDLENQIETLREFCNKNGVVVSDEYADICSGMNLDRKNFQKLLDEVTEYKVKSVYVTYKDRLTRLSFDMFKRLLSKYGTEIVVLNEIDNPKEIEKEIFEEIITLLHSFSMKMYSSRRKEKLQLMEKDLRLQAQVDENTNEES